MPSVTLSRAGRTLSASGPDNGPLPPEAVAYLTEALSYLEKKFDPTAAAYGGSQVTYTRREQFTKHPHREGVLTFPLGLRRKVTAGLRAAGLTVRYAGRPLREENPKAFEPDWDGLAADFQVYPDQAECLSRMLACDGGVVSAATGVGKSVLLRMVSRLLGRAKIHVVTRMTTLADEIHSDLCAVIPRVGFVGGGKRRFERVTVFVADSLHHGMGDADVVLADEVHELASPKYAAKLGMYDRAVCFGFSATPKGRADGRDPEVEALFGPEIFTVSYQEAEAMGRVVPITVEWLRVPPGPDVAGVDRMDLREKLGVWCNDARNDAIAARVREFGPDEQVLVMVKTIEHAVQLKSRLPEFTLAYAANGMDERRLGRYQAAGLLPEDEVGLDRRRVHELRRAFAAGTLKKVIANYVWSTGVNFRNLAVLVRADAAGSTIRDGQIPGRVCRRIPGVKESALLIDCWDDWTGPLYGKALSRRRNYQGKGWAQTWSEPAGVKR